MDLAQMEQIATNLANNVETLNSRVSALEDGQQAAFAPVNNYIIKPEGKTKITGTGMEWQGAWNKLIEYEPYDVVTYDEHAYVCTQAVPAIEYTEGGEGPPAEDPEGVHYSFPGRAKGPEPISLLVPGEQVEGELVEGNEEEEEEGSPNFKQRVFDPEEPWKADIWELVLNEDEANDEIVLSGFPEKGMFRTEDPIEHNYRPFFMDDYGDFVTPVESLHELPGGEIKVTELYKNMKNATKTANGIRFYVAIFGGLYLTESKGEEDNIVKLPTRYTFTASGAPMYVFAGNLPPSEDEAHWALVA